MLAASGPAAAAAAAAAAADLGCTLSTAAQLSCSPQWPRQRPAPFLYSRPLPLAKTAAPPSPPPPHCRRRAPANCSALSSSTKEGNPSAFHLDACGGQQRPPRPALCSLGRRGPRPGQGGGRLRRRKTRPYRAVATSAPPNPKHVVQFSPLSSFTVRPLLPPPFPLAAAGLPAAAQEHTPF